MYATSCTSQVLNSILWKIIFFENVDVYDASVMDKGLFFPLNRDTICIKQFFSFPNYTKYSMYYIFYVLCASCTTMTLK